MGAGRVLVGMIFCIIAVMIIIIFVTLGLSVDDLVGIGLLDATLYQSIFLVAIHPYSFMVAFAPAEWSVLAALAVGAFIGGLIAKGAKGGLSVGLLSFSILLLLQIAVGVFFNLSSLIAWYGLLELGGGSVLIDMLLAAAILAVCGAVGGALTGGEN